jgi:hypothetical protein
MAAPRTLRGILPPLLLLAALLGAGACEEEPRRKRGDDDDEGSGATGAGAGSGASGAQGGNSNGGGGSGPTCLEGGQACESFDECCSGVCDNQLCTDCALEGEGCGLSGCCDGLNCNSDFLCTDCKPESASCDLASECCSNVCDTGFCGKPGPTNCNTGASCQACVDGACSHATCADQHATCDAEPDCPALMSCLEACNGNGTCIDECITQFEAGIDAADDLLVCLCAVDVCDGDCSSLCFGG